MRRLGGITDGEFYGAGRLMTLCCTHLHGSIAKPRRDLSMITMDTPGHILWNSVVFCEPAVKRLDNNATTTTHGNYVIGRCQCYHHKLPVDGLRRNAFGAARALETWEHLKHGWVPPVVLIPTPEPEAYVHVTSLCVDALDDSAGLDFTAT